MSTQGARFWLIPARTHALILLACGLTLTLGGAYLLVLQGSLYYAFCGTALCASAVLLWFRRGEGAILLVLLVCSTLAWALWEAGFGGWVLLPRIGMLLVLGALAFLPPIWRPLSWRSARPARFWSLTAMLAAIAVGVALRIIVPPQIPADPIYQVGTIEFR